MSGNGQRPFGRRISGPVTLVMFVTFFAALISSEVLHAWIRDTDATAAIISHRYFGLKYFDFVCQFICIASLTWLGTYHLFMGKWRWLSGLGMALGLLASVGYGWYMLTYSSSLARVLETVTHFPQPDEQEYRSTLSRSDLPIEQRSRLSALHASSRYRNTGESESYLDKDGTFKTYVPSSDDVNIRKIFETTRTSGQIIASMLLWEGWVLIAGGLIAFAIGVACARADRKAGNVG